METRAEHLAWCKQRALDELDRGNVEGAFASFASDVTKHPETSALYVVHGALGLQLLIADDAAGMRKHIEGFN